MLEKIVHKWEQVLKARFINEMKKAFCLAWKKQLIYINYKSSTLTFHWLVNCFCVHSAAIHHMLCTNSVYVFLKFSVKQNLGGTHHTPTLESMLMKSKRWCGPMFYLCVLQVPEVVSIDSRQGYTAIFWSSKVHFCWNLP